MKMKTNNILSILSIITLFLINNIHATDIKAPLKNELPSNNKENYYMIFVNNGSSSDGSHQKREETEQHINAIINEISNIIMDNKDTYENPSILEELQQNNSLEKRENQDNNSAYAYTISSLDDKAVIYSYLSNDVVDKVNEIPSVMGCMEDREFKLNSYNNNDSSNMDSFDKLNEILNETQWSGVSVRENSSIHLSLISQGKFHGNSTDQYDKNYYYPSSAGKDIDIFILDSGFNFRHPEFANKDERTTKCAFVVKQGRIFPSKYDDYCIISSNIHGLGVSDVAGGLKNGVANKANIYGISLYDNNYRDDEYTEYVAEYFPEFFDLYTTEYPSDYPGEDLFLEEEPKPKHIIKSQLFSNVLAALKYVNDNMLRPNKAVFNFSFGEYLDEEKGDKYYFDYLRDYIDYMSNKGAVFIAAAGNNSRKIEKDGDPSTEYPCAYDNVICVGAIDSAGINTLNENLKDELDNSEIGKLYVKNNKKMNPNNYRVAHYSNFGKKVDIYAPGYFEVEYRDAKGKDHKEIVRGTSFASPIVVGVAATIMSENPNIKFNSKKMLEYLTDIGEKNIIEGILEGDPNVFINNGKHSVYSGSDDLSDEEINDIIDLNDEDIDIDEVTDSFSEDETN